MEYTNNKEVVFRHFRRTTNNKVSSTGGLTFCIDKSLISTGVLAVSFARCSNKDNFNKSLGRVISLGRNDGNYCRVLELNKQGYKATIRASFPELFQNAEYE